MKTESIKFKTVDEYIATFPAGKKRLLTEMRKTIKAAAPKADEVISYNIPAYKLDGMLVYFAGFKEHIGFYPVSSAIREFSKELSKYESSKGTVRFPLDEPLPLALISRIVKFRVKENIEKSKAKQLAKKK